MELSEILGYLWGSIEFLFIGLFMGITIIYLLRRGGYLKRDNDIIKIIVGLYYLYFPIVFALVFWFGGTILKGRAQALKAVDEVHLYMAEEGSRELKAFFDTHVEAYLNKPALPSNKQMATDFVESEYLQNQYYIFKQVLRLTVEFLLDKTIGDMTNPQQRIKVLTDGVSVSIFAAALSPIKQLVTTDIDMIFMFFLIPVIFSFFGAMLLPSLEIMYAAYVRRRATNIIETE